ncbi:34b6a205-fad3-48a6-926b-be6a0e883212 [Sclerotinia trifoliorum]|uniref:34b6a205-fad3-48a6-926b-be6a0e883212 n=1 Tax=Sclerotinia trifoliorum TaxID=28548 RepID=A0A8H2VYR1_9HELO|nr:34b6a205-fad3-48a6-926b-be6a0e883212 [Sclerotinia trifoliorum]
MFQNTLAFLLQFFFFALTFAAPVEIAGHGNAWKYGSGGGVIGFIVLILDIIVFIEVLKSNRPPSHKLLWCLVVFLFPILGLIIYWLFSNRQAHNSGSGSYEAIP